MIKKHILSLLIIAVLTSCTSSLKRMHSGNYDGAIQQAVHKLNSKKKKESEILVLEEAYQKANNRDKDKILFMKKEGSPDCWGDVYAIYSQMKYRQDLVKPLLPLHVESQNRDARFEILDFDNEIINAKKNASEYSYAHALSLLDKNNRMDARKAYTELLKVKNMYSEYKDVDQQLNRARDLGISYVLFKMQNTTGVPLPPTFEEELTKITLTDLDGDWIRYHTHEIKDMHYDYTILVNMKNISVSPEGVKEIHYTESKDVSDGFQYALDAHGNVKKDSLGNDIKIPRTKTIRCNVVETYLSKKSIIAGTLDYIDNTNNQLLKTAPIASENFFEYRFATFMGDGNALKPETFEKTQRQPIVFPPGFDMLLKAGETLKGMVKDIIYNNKSILY
jgi:hypothetical protein